VGGFSGVVGCGDGWLRGNGVSRGLGLFFGGQGTLFLSDRLCKKSDCEAR